MFLFLLLTELFASKPKVKKDTRLNPGKQAMLEPFFFPVLFFKCWTPELSRWFKEGSGGHYEEAKAET